MGFNLQYTVIPDYATESKINKTMHLSKLEISGQKLKPIKKKSQKLRRNSTGTENSLEDLMLIIIYYTHVSSKYFRIAIALRKLMTLMRKNGNLTMLKTS